MSFDVERALTFSKALRSSPKLDSPVRNILVYDVAYVYVLVICSVKSSRWKVLSLCDGRRFAYLYAIATTGA